MAKTKSGKLYKQIKSHSNTRREYMGGVPGSRITQFDLGDKAASFPVTVSLVADERCQIIHNALESTRVSANRVLLKGCGASGYHLKVRVYPHEVLRENKQASGAGADRVSQGMRQSFGKPVGTAARCEIGQAILTVRTTAERFTVVKEAFRKANTKLPIPTRLVIEKGEDDVRKFVASGAKASKLVGSTAPADDEEEAAPATPAAGKDAAKATDAKEAKAADKGAEKAAAKPAEKAGEKKPAKK